MSQLLYTHSRQDLEKIVEIVIDRIRKTEGISTNNFPNAEEDRLTQKEAAQLLGISVTSIISYKKKKKIPYYQIGRTIFYSKKELLDLAKRNRDLIPSRR